MIRRLLGLHFAAWHLGAAIRRLCHRNYTWSGHLRAEKGYETNNQQSSQAGFAHDVLVYSGLIQIKAGFSISADWVR